MSKREPNKLAAPPATGPQYWRSLEEQAKRNDPALRAMYEAEFAPGHTSTPPSAESSDVSRRSFLTLVSASLALSGLAACRRPVEKVLPYTKMPETVIPGIPQHYATVMSRGGESLGLLVESHEGRPTKIEGNPDHPSSYGGADAIAQASILDLYDMDRSTTAVNKGKEVAPEGALKALHDLLAKQAGDQGAKVRLLMQPSSSPSALRLRGEFLKRFPKAKAHTWAPMNASNARAGAALAFGKPMNAIVAYEQAKVIVSLDSDFLCNEPGSVRAQKGFAQSRRLRSTADAANMSRLYVFEPSMTVTGSTADHRFKASASEIAAIALGLASQLASAHHLHLADIGADKVKAPAYAQAWIAAVAKDLAAAGGKGVVVAGSRQPAIVHAVAHAINDALGASGTTVRYADVADPDEKDNAADLADLVQAMAAGQVDTLVMIGGNPVYDAPADLKFADALAKVPNSVHVADRVDETGDKCAWHIPRAHELEAWGDQKSLDGTVSIQQPLILPLHGGVSDLEVLAVLADAKDAKPHDIVRETMRGGFLAARKASDCKPSTVKPGALDCADATGQNRFDIAPAELERDWKKALRDGFVAKADLTAAPKPTLRGADIAAAIGKYTAPAAPTADAPEITFAVDTKLFDGRHANNPWLLEWPEPMTKIVWDNALLIHPKTAQKKGIKAGDMVAVKVGSSTVNVPAWPFPGQAESSVAVSLGWGRKKAGRLGDGKGFDAYPLRTSQALGFAAAQLGATGEVYKLAQTQDHDSMEERPIAREATLDEYKKSPNFADLQSPPPRSLPLWKDQDYSHGYQWGMAIDLNACTGCGACLIACQAENNVPNVGKIETARGREMYWLRVDRYLVTDEKMGATMDDPAVAHQPMACVHCEEAPCENVCPVNATDHSPEGINEMAYNRCIGTRYCANNCPYKVRRFNYLNWHNDSLWKKEGGLPETVQMQQNPNVSVRFRGVMEKCSYCIQRIQMAKIASKREKRAIFDGEIKTACQQTCPSDAIVFGNVNDKGTQVSKLSMLDRRYALLGELGTKPRTTYLGKVRNLNPELVKAAPAGQEHGGAEHKEHG